MPKPAWWLLPLPGSPYDDAAWMPGKIAALDDPQVVRLYRVLSEIFDGDEEDDPRLAEAAAIMACPAEQAYAADEAIPGEEIDDDLPHDLIDALAVEPDPAGTAAAVADARARLVRLEPDGAAGRPARLTCRRR